MTSHKWGSTPDIAATISTAPCGLPGSVTTKAPEDICPATGLVSAATPFSAARARSMWTMPGPVRVRSGATASGVTSAAGTSARLLVRSAEKRSEAFCFFHIISKLCTTMRQDSVKRRSGFFHNSRRFTELDKNLLGLDEIFCQRVSISKSREVAHPGPSSQYRPP